MKSFAAAILIGLITLGLSACDRAREELGLNRQSPDEFAVLKRAPLTLPPSYDLRPPRAGALSNAESALDAQSQARRVLLGQNATNTTQETALQASTGTQILLDQAGATNTQSDIRGILDRESSVLSTTDQTVAERLLFWTGDEGETFISEAERLDANAEAERLNESGITAPTPGETRANPIPQAEQ